MKSRKDYEVACKVGIKEFAKIMRGVNGGELTSYEPTYLNDADRNGIDAYIIIAMIDGITRNLSVDFKIRDYRFHDMYFLFEEKHIYYSNSSKNEKVGEAMGWGINSQADIIGQLTWNEWGDKIIQTGFYWREPIQIAYQKGLMNDKQIFEKVLHKSGEWAKYNKKLCYKQTVNILLPWFFLTRKNLDVPKWFSKSEAIMIGQSNLRGKTE